VGKSTLRNTRLKFVSFGSEETGLTGSLNYVKLKKEELHRENAHIINIDSIREPQHVCIITKETMNGTVYSDLLIEKVYAGFSSKNIPVKKGATPIGGTDGVFFVRAGLQAVSLIGLSMDKLDPTYHTRRDVIQNLNPVALENVKEGLSQFVVQWDHG
jgi:Zn-dependent M28 family amino/carboxypeptidase